MNEYSAVISIEGLQAVKVKDPGIFHRGDTALLIQMKGFGILTEPPEDYGKPQNVDESGNYEFLIVDRVEDNLVFFTRELLKEYNAGGSVQLVKVRGYYSARVTSTLTAPPWDGETGGVVAVIALNRLILEADIDVSSLGFRGGIPLERTIDECSENDPDEYLKFSFPGESEKAGRKGEGPVSWYLEDGNPISVENNLALGKGRLATGGGGGNGRFAGGGGGSNYGQGGFGGGEASSCPHEIITAAEMGGIGGFRLEELLHGPGGSFTNRFFMGGGGGGSTQYAEYKATSGGNGGGIAIIIAYHLEVSGGSGIHANGGSVTSLASAGAGGGGGGGTIVTSVDHYHGNHNFSVRGGRGGDTGHPVRAGTGGGGGGGKIIHAGSSFPPGIQTHIQPGASGINLVDNDPHGSTIGTPGGVIEELDISLNGLLFNGISTETTLICEDIVPAIINGTQPRGGIRPYEFEWWQKTENSEWTLIPGETEKDYQPGPLSESTIFIRVVKEQDDPPVIDSSNYLQIIVQPRIEGNIIGPGQTICEGDIPPDIGGQVPAAGGTGTFEYSWLMRPYSSGDWNIAYGTNDLPDYSPPALSDTTLLTRVVRSGVCIDTSNIVTVNVHPQIKNNILNDDQAVCYGNSAGIVSSPEGPGGGLGPGSYTYSWESLNDDIWDPTGDDAESYIPGELSASVSLRRTITSGACTDVSPPHTITVLPVITYNLISGNQTACFMDSPGLLTGSEPEGGDGTYSYGWESLSGNNEWIPVTGNGTEKDYLPPALSDTTSFRRIVYSGMNGACSDTSNFLEIGFYPFSGAVLTASSDTICMGEQAILSFRLSGNSPWTLTWSNGIDEFIEEDLLHEDHSVNVSPVSADSTTYSYNIVSLTDRFGCKSPDGQLAGEAKVRVYAYPEPDPGTGGEVCGTGFHLNAVPHFGKGTWGTTTGGVFSPGESHHDAVVTVPYYGTHTFRWTETNWKCAASSEMDVIFYEQPSGAVAGPDQSQRFRFETYLDARLPENMPSAHGIWELWEGAGQIVFPDDPGTKVTGLGLGHNIFRWTVFNGTCEPVSDLVTIKVNDLNIPNAFSPNESGFNDRFIISGIENSLTSELTVFNRQGNVVFRTTGYMNDWDGRNADGDPLPDDTYYYILSVDNKYSYRGFIIIKR